MSKSKTDIVFPERINYILNTFVDMSIETYDKHIQRIILYGSYARGDYNDESDIDLMVLVDFPREEISNLDSKLSDIGYEISMRNDFVEISTFMQNEDFFDKWVSSYPFYNNVKSEGVELYVR